MPSGVHDSALIVNAFRASKVDVSADRYANVWVSEESEVWACQLASQGGSTEVLVHALRHRFFLERLTQFLEQAPDGVFINIGAAFTNYPHLIPSRVPCCEVDTRISLEFKQEKLMECEAGRDLPTRAIQFITVDDLNDAREISGLQLALGEWIGGRSSFLLFEAIFFYLTLEAIQRL